MGETISKKSKTLTCWKCHVPLVYGVALVNETVCFDDFGGDAGSRGSTCSNAGSAKLVECIKCPSCGVSFLRHIDETEN